VCHCPMAAVYRARACAPLPATGADHIRIHTDRALTAHPAGADAGGEASPEKEESM
jgi:hypothetical protein